MSEDRFDEKTRPYDNYLKVVREEIQICKGTGYDREKTAVVPLAEIARREEERLRALQAPQDEQTLEIAREDARVRRGVIPIGEILDVLRAAATVEEVAGVLTEMVANVVPRVLLFWERGGMLYGFASSGMGLSEVKLLTIEIPRRMLWDLTATVFELDSFRGAPQLVGQAPEFFAVLGVVPPEILLIPVQVTSLDRWLLYADAGSDMLPDFEMRLLEVIASRAGARADLLLERAAGRSI